MDPKQIIEIRNLIKGLGKKHTIILSSHILPEIQAVCERIIVINKGNLVADGTPDSLAHNLSTEHKVIVRMAGDEKEIKAGLKTLKNVVSVESFGEKEPGVYELSVEAREGTDLRRDLFHFAAKKDWPILAMRNTDLSLEDVFLRLTSASYLRDNAALQGAMKGGESA